MGPLSRDFLIKQGSCCGNKCTNCPYSPKWTKGSTNISLVQGDYHVVYDPIRLDPPGSQEVYGSCNSNVDCPDGFKCIDQQCAPTSSVFDEVLKEHNRIVERLLNPFKDLGTDEEAKIALDTQRRLAGNNLQYVSSGSIYYDYEDQQIKRNSSDSTLVLNVPYDAITVKYKYPHSGVTSIEYK